jgi:threonine aldolase
LPALDALEGAEQRFAAVRAAGERLLAGLAKTPGFKVQRVEDGSNIAFLEVAPARVAGLEQRLKDANARIGKIADGKVQLGFNESILRRETGYLLAAFTG